MGGGNGNEGCSTERETLPHTMQYNCHIKALVVLSQMSLSLWQKWLRHNSADDALQI